MPSDPTIDVERLLQPISEETPCGVALKEDPVLSADYYLVKDARVAAREAERAALEAAQDETATTPDPPNWDVVIRLAADILEKKSKDLWVASWLLEGLTRKHGFAGLRDGFRVIQGLCARYWDGIHPRPDEDGLATTLAQYVGLNGDGVNGSLLAPIAAIPLTNCESMRPLSGRDYIDAADLASKDADYRARRIEAGAVSLEDFDKAARETPPAFFQQLREDVEAASQEFDALTALLEDLCGKDPRGFSEAPSASGIRAVLDAAADQVRVVSGGEPASVAEDIETDGSSEATEAAATRSSTSAGAGVGEINSRESALRALSKVAEYFRRTEPHSPLSYSLEQAVRWGRMSLPELISELVSDTSARKELFRLTGIQTPRDDD